MPKQVFCDKKKKNGKETSQSVLQKTAEKHFLMSLLLSLTETNIFFFNESLFSCEFNRQHICEHVCCSYTESLYLTHDNDEEE